MQCALLLALLSGVGATAARLEEAKCAELGFLSHQLSCSTCDEMASFEGLAEQTELLDACRSCCTESQANDVVYDEAILKLNERTLSSFPQVAGFLASHIQKYPAIRVQWTMRGYPTLVLMKDGNTRGAEKVWSWKEDQIRSFAEHRLNNAAARAGGMDHSATYVKPTLRKSRKDNAGIPDEYMDLLFPPDASGSVAAEAGAQAGSSSSTAGGGSSETKKKKSKTKKKKSPQ